MKNSFFVLDEEVNDKFCMISENVEGVESNLTFIEGVPIEHNFPAESKFFMDEEHLGMKIVDFVANDLSYLIVSNKVKNLFEKEGITNIEYIAVSIFDQKKKEASDSHYIANILGSVECFDYDKSVYKTSSMTPGRINRIKKVVLIEGEIPDSEKLFRLKALPRIIIIRKDLVDLLENNNCKGMRILPLNKKIMI